MTIVVGGVDTGYHGWDSKGSNVYHWLALMQYYCLPSWIDQPEWYEGLGYFKVDLSDYQYLSSQQLNQPVLIVFQKMLVEPYS